MSQTISIEGGSPWVALDLGSLPLQLTLKAWLQSICFEQFTIQRESLELHSGLGLVVAALGLLLCPVSLALAVCELFPFQCCV